MVEPGETTVADMGPGDAVKAGVGEEVDWTIALTTVVPVEKVEIVVNGSVVWSEQMPRGRKDLRVLGYHLINVFVAVALGAAHGVLVQVEKV